MFTSLRQRLVVLVLMPVAILLTAAGTLGFVYIRGKMLDQWREASLLKLERASHFIEMRLMRPLDRIQMVISAADTTDWEELQNEIVRQLSGMRGISRVRELPSDGSAGRSPTPRGGHTHMPPSGGPLRAEIVEVTPTRLEGGAGRRVISLGIDLKDEKGRTGGRIEVTMELEYLLQDLQSLGWWQSDVACLVDQSGAYLAHTGAMAGMMEGRSGLGETGDALELAILRAMGSNRSGTAMGSGHPPDRVAGFFRIGPSPFTIIVYAEGRKILKPIVQFRMYYSLAGVVCIGVIIALIRFVEGRTAKSIKQVSDAAQKVARGTYDAHLSHKGRDEISRLVQSFNTMIEGLRERDRILNTFGRYVDPDVAKELLRHPDAVRLGGRKCEVAILMSDIRGFSALADVRTPEETIRIINRYFSHMIAEIHEHKGIIVDFFGDGILVFFDPLGGEVEKSIDQAILCAFAMQRAEASLNIENAELGLPQLRTGIGVHAGDVVVGNIGSETRAKYGIVGSAVNVTERIQSFAKGGEVVVSDPAYKRVRSHFAVVRTFAAKLKGVQEGQTLHVVEDPSAVRGC